MELSIPQYGGRKQTITSTLIEQAIETIRFPAATAVRRHFSKSTSAIPFTLSTTAYS